MPIPEVAGLPAGGPATLPGVKAHLGITDTADDDRLTAIVAAVNATVRRLRVAADAAGATDWAGAPHVTEGATMLAARLFRRKNSPAGVEAFTDLGAVYVMRNDPDIALLLRRGPYAEPGIG